MTAPLPSTRFTRLAGSELPIQLAPMGGPATPELAIAVAEAGGHASYPCVAQTPQAVAEGLDRIAARTPAFSANFIGVLLDEAALEVALERAPMIDFHVGEPTGVLVDRIHAAGALVGWQVGSLSQALAAQEAGCDLLIAQGTEAGGRLAGTTALLPLLAELRDAVEVPLLAAGGIATPAAVATALAAGADGVRVGTRFLAAAESAAHPAWIEALVAAASGDTVVTTAFSRGVPVQPHRVLRSSLEATERTEKDVVGEMEVGGLVREVERFAPLPPNRSFRGAVSAMPFYAGRSVGAVREVLPAAEIVADLALGVRGAAEPARFATQAKEALR